MQEFPARWNCATYQTQCGRARLRPAKAPATRGEVASDQVQRTREGSVFQRLAWIDNREPRLRLYLRTQWQRHPPHIATGPRLCKRA